MEIKNGFIKSTHGTWFSMIGLNRTYVDNDEDDEDCFKIVGMWIDDGEDYPITLDVGFTNYEDAQEALDEMMNS